MMRPRDRRQQQRQCGIDGGPEEYTTTTEALAKEDEHKDFNNYNKGVGRGYTTRPRDRRRQRRQQRLDSAPDGLATIIECPFSLLLCC